MGEGVVSKWLRIVQRKVMMITEQKELRGWQ